MVPTVPRPFSSQHLFDGFSLFLCDAPAVLDGVVEGVAEGALDRFVRGRLLELQEALCIIPVRE
eukprot:1236964-Rhodomonas_salina.2